MSSVRSLAAMSSNPADYPAGYFSQYIGNHTLIVAGVCIVLEIAFVCLRFYGRRLAKSRWGLDDYMLAPALLFNLAQCMLAIIMVREGGVGYHLPAVLINKPAEVVMLDKSELAMQWTYAFAVVFPKLSILAFYLRIFIGKRFVQITYAVAAVAVATMIATCFTALFRCSPVSYQWDKSINGECIDTLSFYRWATFPNILTDVVMLVLPFPMVWNLNATPRKKIGLILLFVLGSVGLVASCVRFGIFFVTEIWGDITWAASHMITWTTIEPCAYLIAACLPSLRPLFKRYFPQSVTSRTSGDDVPLSRPKEAFRIRLHSPERIGLTRPGTDESRISRYAALDNEEAMLNTRNDTQMTTMVHGGAGTKIVGHLGVQGIGRQEEDDRASTPTRQISVRKDISVETSSRAGSE